MSKKRKAVAPFQAVDSEIQISPRESRKRIRTYEDVADSDEEFHLNQDEIRLGEEPDVKRRRKWSEQEAFLQPSDEEVLGYSQDERESDAEQQSRRDAPDSASEAEDQGDVESDDEGLVWGTSKADLYGADEIETEEQALEEEAEAIRLQKKQLEAMKAADYGFDEDEWQQGQTQPNGNESSEHVVVTEVLPPLQIAPDLGPAERLKLLKARYPEFEPLSKELLNLQERYRELREGAKSSPMGALKLKAASAYIGALVMYFTLLTSTASSGNTDAMPLAAAQLRDHPLMDSLVQCRTLWNQVENLTDDENHVARTQPFVQRITSEIAQKDLENDSGRGNTGLGQAASREAPEGKKTRAERHADAMRVASEQRKAERLKRAEEGLADLDVLIGSRKAIKAPRTIALDEDSDVGEEAPLTAREAADKDKRKKSLRFYTSQIAQKANKRGAAGRSAGGDDDIPHRERLRDRQARLNAEAEKRGKRSADTGDDLGAESDEEDRRQAKQIRANADDDDYYDFVATRTAKKKSEKAALAEAQRQAALEGGQVVQEESVGPDGKRKISYAIEKNKGLTPHRKKDVRNPRVKKRKKFDEKKKKLASIKPVYKGGEGRGGYGGELTGIKKGLVKSTKLS